MNTKYSVVGSGFIGKYVHAKLNACLYDRDTVATMPLHQHDVIIVAAPTGNRLLANASPDIDLEDCKNLISTIEKCNYNYLVHVSTVDVYSSCSSANELPENFPPKSSYGHNRWFLEQKFQMFPRCHTVRLPSLVDLTIQKNILFDLKNNKWLDKIDLYRSVQWYPLNRLASDIPLLLLQGKKFENLISPPIKNIEIVQRYRPSLVQNLMANIKLDSLNYDVRSSTGEYFVPIQEIWKNIDKYFSYTPKTIDLV
jgi:hypothetical protein